ncbi:DUF2695 domain-containing protein [Ruania albidiflava]|uniref:DUF2695 domain-containing protein n=1 Tax=Ruania albidiflava TaxID=366586 RepID=UPI0023EFE87C|nr:DUF2695 domain-containing protein [Ruania albidiflava]
MTNLTIEDTETYLRQLASELTDPRPGECLLCYVYRMLEHGCRGLRWALRYRDQRAPRATALERRLGQVGGYCDCEIFMNGYDLRSAYLGEPGGYAVYNGVLRRERPYPNPMPGCLGVGRGSTRPCGLWARRPRGGYLG